MGIGGWIVGVFMAVIAVCGLFLASAAHGNQTFYTMGLGLFVFGCALIFGVIKQHYDHQS